MAAADALSDDQLGPANAQAFADPFEFLPGAMTVQQEIATPAQGPTDPAPIAD